MQKQEGYVYIVRCADGSYYTGSTTDLHRRIHKHQSGKGAKYTRGRLPIKVVYVEVLDSLNLAMSREKKIQQLTRAEKERLIGGTQSPIL